MRTIVREGAERGGLASREEEKACYEKGAKTKRSLYFIMTAGMVDVLC
jgi:hypothetical protein